jgi:hypothetical protein
VVPNLDPKYRPHEHIKDKFLFRWTLVEWFSRIVGGSLSAKPEFCASIIKDALEESESGLGLILSGLEDCVVGPLVEGELQHDHSRRYAEYLQKRKEAAREALDFVLNETWPKLRIALLSDLPEPWVHRILGRSDIPCVYEKALSEKSDPHTWTTGIDTLWCERERFDDLTQVKKLIHDFMAGDLDAIKVVEQTRIRECVSMIDEMFKRQPELRTLLHELELPNEGPGVPINTGPLGGTRWHQLVSLYKSELIRYTGKGFVGPSPKVAGVMK